MCSGEVIGNLRDLQSLTFDTSAEKEKQKAEVKHILQQKQRALSDLFKMLSEIGQLSFLQLPHVIEMFKLRHPVLTTFSFRSVVP